MPRCTCANTSGSSILEPLVTAGGAAFAAGTGWRLRPAGPGTHSERPQRDAHDVLATLRKSHSTLDMSFPLGQDDK